MKLFPRLLIFLCSLAVMPVNLALAAAPTDPMTSTGFKVQGVFASAFGTNGTPFKMSSTNFFIPEGSMDGYGPQIVLQKVTVGVTGVDVDDANILKSSSGFPGFSPGVSPTAVAYDLPNPPLLSAPNVFYLPKSSNANQVRYVLIGYSGEGDITSGSASSGTFTTVSPAAPLSTASGIIWNYQKQVRVSVTTTGEFVPLNNYDRRGDTTNGSTLVTNLDSTTGLAVGMTVFGNGIQAATTIASINATNSTVTLSQAALFTMSQNFPSSGQRITFAASPSDTSADPRECAGSSAAVCAGDTSAARSGVHFYDAGDTSGLVLTVQQSFSDTDPLARTRTLTQVVTVGGSATPPVDLLVGDRKTLTVIGLSSPMTVQWRYDESSVFYVGSPISPVRVPTGKTVNLAVKPDITITATDASTPGDTVDTAFVWDWDNTTPTAQRMRFFPVHPVDSFKIRWTCTDGSTFFDAGNAPWPVTQTHIAGVPVNLQPPGATNAFSAISYTTSGATTTLTEFNAHSSGKSVLRFVTSPQPPDLKAGTTFIVVGTEEKPSNSTLQANLTDWNIGRKITDLAHTDPENGTKTGYLFYDGGVYDGAGADSAYDRTTRKGAIIPVNVSKISDLKPLVVVWYALGAGKIGWPTTTKMYKAVWPTPPSTIIIGSGIPVSPISKPRAMVYNQPDSSKPGFNPNEEHALVTGDTLYALRDDLNAVNGNNYSLAYVLLKSYNTSANEWQMDVYKVSRPSSFSVNIPAGTQIVSPLPESFLVPEECGIKRDVNNKEINGEWYLRDHKGGHWAKAANWTVGDTKADTLKSEFVMQWYYPMRDDFFWPFTGSLAKKRDDLVPFLNNKLGNASVYSDGDKPIDYTYITYWPETAKVLYVGDTLTKAKNGLPGLYDFKSAEVVFDQNVYEDGGPLGKLYAPERYLYATDVTLPVGMKTEIGAGGMETFPELPFAIQARLFYDRTNKRLGFKGVWITAEGETEWLLPNLMTAAERQTIKTFTTVASSDTSWATSIDNLYALARNPNNIAIPASPENPFKPAVAYDFATKWRINLGLEIRGGKVLSARSFIGEKNALSAGMAQGEGYLVIAENNLDELLDAPVKLHVIKVSKSPVFQGVIKAIKAQNVFDEKLTLHYAGDFGGEPEKFTFEWYYQPVSGSVPSLPSPGAILTGWNKFVNPGTTGDTGLTDITIQGASPLTLSDNWFVARYYYKTAWPLIAEESVPNPFTTPHADTKNWSPWSGANMNEPMLAVGWVKRVVDGLNPLEARVTDFRNNATNTTVSMLSQLGRRYEGPIAMNSDASNLNNLGLISAYDTVLNRTRDFSIDASPPRDYGPTNDALLNISSRLATFYQVLGNEAYADAVDPTIGYSTKSSQYGNMAPSIFSFQNQLDSLLDEELALMYGRDDTGTTTKNAPYYNRLIWNFTQGEGEVAYQQNYNVTDQDHSGLINAGDAKIMYPQGHGDAWGHYLQSISYYYKLLGHPSFSWAPRVEFVLVAGNPIMVDYLDERKFATIAAARARTGAEILDLTYRKFFTDDPAGQWQGYKDTYANRAWGVDEWAHRAGQGAYFDWIMANAILPESIPSVALQRKRFVTDPATGALKEEIITGSNIQQINRSKVPELDSIASYFHMIQSKMTEVDSGVNPLGLVKGVVPFDIDPAQIAAGQTHFEQIYERAVKTVQNAITVYDYANGYTQRLRQNQDTLEQFKQNLTDQERDYKNRLIEIFGYPYADDIGAGKSYPDGYDGPDILHYFYVDQTELTGSKKGNYTTFTTALSDPASLEKMTGLGAFREEQQQVSFNVSKDNYWMTKPDAWTTKRRAPGKIQQSLSELLVAQATYDKAVQKFDGMVGDIKAAKDDLQSQHNLLATQIMLKNDNNNTQIGLTSAINVLHAASIGFRRLSETMDAGMESVVESMPRVAGVALDPTSAMRGTMMAVEVAYRGAVDIAGDAADMGEFSLESAKERVQAGMELKIEISEANNAVKQQLSALEGLVASVDQQLLETWLLKETVKQASGRYQAALAEGLRMLDERMEKRTQSAAEVQEYRFQDLGFRVFRNDAIQKYRAQFDIAARYVYLAATAYDYETNLLGDASGSGRKFLGDIARQSSLGVFSNGQPMSGFPGLADVMARLSQNFAIYKTQLGFNNPQTETNPFSLRYELYRVKSDTTSNAAWRDVLKDHKVDDLWKIPEFKRYCRPFAPESAGPQPGLVFRFPTTVTYGKNFFGWPLSGGDSAYSSSNFSTRIRSVGVWFQNYNNAGLSLTPRVYLVPAGADILRSPTGDGFATREWEVRDQILPVPFPIGDADLKNPAFIPGNDSLSGEFGGIRRLSDFRAYPYSGSFNPSQATSDSRLIGRSVWNNQWMLIIPASTLLFNKDVGMNNFINSVDDIKMFFQTYSYSGI